MNFCASNQGSGMPLDACDNANGSRRLCTITGNPIRGLATSGDNSFLSSSGSDGDIGHCNSGQQLTLGSASQYQFGTISLYSACTLTFSSTRQEYRIQSLALGGAKVVLPAGDYWIDRLVVNQAGRLKPGAMYVSSSTRWSLMAGVSTRPRQDLCCCLDTRMST